MSAERARKDREDFAALLSYPAERAAADILGAVERRRNRLLVAPSAVLPDLVARVLPGSYWPVLRHAPRVLKHAPRVLRRLPGRRRRA